MDPEKVAAPPPACETVPFRTVAPLTVKVGVVTVALALALSFNVSYYENEKVDQLLKDGLATADEDKRGEIYGEVQDIVWKDLPLLCIASDKNIWATSNNITGVYLLGDGSIGMRNARMAAE